MSTPHSQGTRVEQVIFEVADGERMTIAVEPIAYQLDFIGRTTVVVRGELEPGESLEFSLGVLNGNPFLQYWPNGNHTIEANGKIVDQSIEPNSD